jgi:tetratricopeptide (TPR) repeat protein
LIRPATSLAGMRLAPTRGPARALVVAAALAAAVSTFAAMEPPSAAAASQPNLSYISSSTWTADPVNARVHVLTYITATSHAEDQNGYRGYYSTLELTLPPTATAVTASGVDGGDRKVTIQGLNSSGQAASIALGERLYNGDTTSLVLAFDLVDRGGSTDRDLRIGHTVMSFPVSAFGSPDAPGSSVTVVFPSDFTVQEEFGTLTRTIFDSGQIIFASGPLDDATSLSAWFTATQPVPESFFRTRDLTIGTLRVTLRYWADDPGWADAVASVLARGIPLLEGMIGLGDPVTPVLTVTEASSQEIGGVAGTFNQSDGQVQVSYLADPFVILHEAAHLWFNDSLASERWIEEGFASYYADQAVRQMHLVDHAPQMTDRIRQAAIPFNDWITEGVPSSATDAYLYAATLTVAGEIADLAGQSGLQAVWRAARAGTAAYQPREGLVVEHQSGPIDWRRFLDLLETTTGQSFENIWHAWVVTPTQAAMLGQRLAAQATYDQLVSLAGAWTLPPEIRRDLDSWQFDQAQAALSQARLVLAARQQIAGYATREQTTPPNTLRQVFEGSTVQAAATEARVEIDALDALAAAAAAKASSDQGTSFLIGTDPNADLDAARQAFAQGNLDASVSLAQSAEATWRRGYAAELVRVVGLVVGSIGLFLLAFLGVWVAAGRRHLRLAAGAAGAPSQTGPLAIDTDAAGLADGLSDVADGQLDRIPVLAMAGRRTGRRDEGFGKSGRVDKQAGRVNGDTDDESDELGADPEGGDTDGDGENPFGPGFGESADREESAYDLLVRGQALLRDRHNAQAAVVLERAARVEPGKGSILEALGRAYFNSGQHGRAAETFEALLEVDPSAHYGHFALGLSLSRLGRDQDARKHLRLAVALDPSSELYRKALQKAESQAS